MTNVSQINYMIVDDHPFICEGVKNFLAPFPKLHCVGEFNETRTLLHSNIFPAPHLLLLDLNLKGINGQGSLKLIKQKFPNCKVIALTQYIHLDEELLSLGFDGCVYKGDPDELLPAIDAVFNGKKYFHSKEPASGMKGIEPDEFLAGLRISGREIEVMCMVADNLTNRKIAERLFISEFTVETHRKNFNRKAGNLKGGDLEAFLVKHGYRAPREH